MDAAGEALGLAALLFPRAIVRQCCIGAIAKQSHCCHDPFMPVEMTSAATWLGSAHLRLGACAGPPRRSQEPGFTIRSGCVPLACGQAVHKFRWRTKAGWLRPA